MQNTVTYSYGNDVSGNPSHVANINPFRYRNYYYDTETGFYYLNSRYYDPQTGRFINPDGYVSTGQGLLSYNMFAYCLNNPVTNIDPSGHSPVPASVYFAGMSGYSMGEYLRVEREYQQSLFRQRNQEGSSQKLPLEGEPNTKVKTPNGKTEREYGPDGRAKRDTHWGHTHSHKNLGIPHYHDWEWDGDTPTLGEPYGELVTEYTLIPAFDLFQYDYNWNWNPSTGDSSLGGKIIKWFKDVFGG